MAELVDGETGDLEPFSLQPPHWLQHGGVLHRARDDVALLRAGARRPEDREVVRLGAATREDDLIAPSAEDIGYSFARLVDSGLCSGSVDMLDAGRVAEDLGEEWPHGVANSRVDWGRRVMIEVDG